MAYGLAHQTFSFAGYSAHLPPEVIQGIAQDAISDLYSMGITFHRLLNNISAFPLGFTNNDKWLEALQKERFPERLYAPHIPYKITKVVKKSIRADRKARYQTCLQFRQALEKIPLAIEWYPIDTNTWEGNYGDEKFNLLLYLK